jgi:hypothetical protein
MSRTLEARLRRLETRGDQGSKQFIVVGDEAERDALARAGGIPAGAVVIITGVPRTCRSFRTN